MSKKKRTNVLLLVSDHHRGDWMPYADDVFNYLDMEPLPIKMPTIKKLMDNGVTFTNCITPSPLCAPARACLASGLNYEHCNVIDNGQDYPLNQRTFYSCLNEAGYNVGGTGKFDLHKPALDWGLDGWVGDLGKMGFTHGIDNEGKWDGYNTGRISPKGPYFKYLHDSGLVQTHIQDYARRRIDANDTEATNLPEEAYCDNWLSNNTVNMIKDFSKDKPWFVQVNFTGPHAPWDITKRMKEVWKDVQFPQPVGNDKLDEKKLNEIRQNFAAMLENIDRNIALIIDEVAKRGELENTIIIYTADHGDMLGDKNLFGKSLPYNGSVSIPLVVCGMNVKKGIISKQMVELQDLAATIVEFCGEAMVEAKDSISLVPILTQDCNENIREYQTSGLNDWKMTTDGKKKTITHNNNIDEVYNLELDKWEINNLQK